MLITIDIGNTNAFCGIFDGSRLCRTWRVEMKKPVNSILRKIISGVGRKKVAGVCVSSVVPWIDIPLKKALAKRFQCEVLFADADTSGIAVTGYEKKEVGSDRLVNAVAAHEIYKKPIIIVDFGTATTFDFVTSRGEYFGGVIAPGINLANRSLTDYTAKLPKVGIKKTKKIIGHKTADSMQAGVFHGYVGLIKHIVKEMKKETRSNPVVIATGGLAGVISPSTDVIDKIMPDLTLKGLKIIWERNRF